MFECPGVILVKSVGLLPHDKKQTAIAKKITVPIIFIEAILNINITKN